MKFAKYFAQAQILTLFTQVSHTHILSSSVTFVIAHDVKAVPA